MIDLERIRKQHHDMYHGCLHCCVEVPAALDEIEKLRAEVEGLHIDNEYNRLDIDHGELTRKEYFKEIQKLREQLGVAVEALKGVFDVQDWSAFSDARRIAREAHRKIEEKNK
jgi:hypothetical protein